jgi:hypothetical protein
VSYALLPHFNFSWLGFLQNLRTLNMSGSLAERVVGNAFHGLTQLQKLDLRGCRITELERGMFTNLSHLQTVFSDNPLLCCAELLPEVFNMANCRSSESPVSSCSQLLGSNTYSWIVLTAGVTALLGNIIKLVSRTCLTKGCSGHDFDVLLLGLFSAHLLMGIYLSILTAADKLFEGEYLWNDHAWKSSAACYVAGFLALLSHEVSVCTNCVATTVRALTTISPSYAGRISLKLHLVLVLFGCWSSCLPQFHYFHGRLTGVSTTTWRSVCLFPSRKRALRKLEGPLST